VEEGVQGADDRGAEPAREVEREVRAEQVAVRPWRAACHQHADQRAESKARGRGLVPPHRPAATLMSVNLTASLRVAPSLLPAHAR
jgi:hypothetical protein